MQQPVEFLIEKFFNSEEQEAINRSGIQIVQIYEGLFGFCVEFNMKEERHTYSYQDFLEILYPLNQWR